jgi:hypothetical protein
MGNNLAVIAIFAFSMFNCSSNWLLQEPQPANADPIVFSLT